MPMKPKPKNPASNTFKLSSELLKGWRRSLIKLGKPPRGINKKALAPDLMIDAIIRESRSDVKTLWSIFTQERSEIGRYLNSPKREVSAYLLGFHLANVARYQSILIRAHQRHNLFDHLKTFEHVHLVDIGCGTGALTSGLLDLLNQFKAVPKSLTIDLVDRQKEFLNSAKTVIEDGFGHTTNLTIKTGRLSIDEYCEKLLSQPLNQSSCIVIQLGYLLNEIQKNRREMSGLTRLLQSLISKKLPLLVTAIDSSIPAHAKFMMNFREYYKNEGLLPIYPCPHFDTCPMLKEERDWCYSEAEWTPPREQLVIDRYLEVERRRLGSSSYILASESFMKSKSTPDLEPVIVGRPTTSRTSSRDTPAQQQTFEYLLCSKNGLEKVKSPRNTDRFQLRGEYLKK